MFLETKLHKANLLDMHYSANEYFTFTRHFGHIEDDHVPFLERGEYKPSYTVVIVNSGFMLPGSCDRLFVFGFVSLS